MAIPRFSYIRPIEKAKAAISMLEILKEKNIQDPVITALMADVKTTSETLLNNIGDKSQKEQSIVIREMDSLRDNMTRVVYYRLKSESCRVDAPERMKAADIILLKVFNDALSMLTLPLVSQSARMREINRQFSEDYTSEVELLGIKNEVELLGNACIEFEKLYDKRSASKESLPSAIGPMVAPLDSALTVLCTYLNSKLNEEAIKAVFDPLFKVTRTPSKPAPEPTE